jgi:hypothetical protein
MSLVGFVCSVLAAVVIVGFVYGLATGANPVRMAVVAALAYLIAGGLMGLAVMVAAVVA